MNLRGREGKVVEEEDETEYLFSAEHGWNETPGWRFGPRWSSDFILSSREGGGYLSTSNTVFFAGGV